MERMDRQPGITPQQVLDTLRLINSRLAPCIPPVSYEMTLEEFRYYRKLYHLHEGLEAMISSYPGQPSYELTVINESVPEIAAISSGEHVEEALSDNDWVLVSPDGQRHRTNDLRAWACENQALFGLQDAEDWRKISKGMRDVANFTVFGRPGPKTFKGWTVEQRPREKQSNTARIWTLVSPAGETVQVFNLQNWVRENLSLFGATDEKEAKHICNKFQQITHSMRTGANRHKSYKGWTVRL